MRFFYKWRQEKQPFILPSSMMVTTVPASLMTSVQLAEIIHQLHPSNHPAPKLRAHRLHSGGQDNTASVGKQWSHNCYPCAGRRASLFQTASLLTYSPAKWTVAKPLHYPVRSGIPHRSAGAGGEGDIVRLGNVTVYIFCDLHFCEIHLNSTEHFSEVFWDVEYCTCQERWSSDRERFTVV